MNLPPPINGTEAYLKAIHDRLGEMLERLPLAPAAEAESAELKEPKRAARKKEG